jgi:hypothetical protein
MKNLLIVMSLVMLPACGGDNFSYPDYEPDMSLGGEPDHGARPTGGNMQVASGSADGAGGGGGTGGAMGTGGDPGSGGDLGAGGDPGSGGAGVEEEPEDSGYEIHYAGALPYVAYGYCGVAQESTFCLNQTGEDANKVWFFECNPLYQPAKEVLTCKRTPDTNYWCCEPVEYFHPRTGWPPEN